MRITPVEHHVELLGPSEGRSPGLHVSDLYNSFYRDAEPGRYTEGEPNVTKMAMGVAWESYLERRLVASGIEAHRPDECDIEHEGQRIAFSPDLYILNGHERGGEIKLTYMSAPESLDDPKFAKWLTQMRVYGHHLQLPSWRLYGLFVNGDYRQHRDPVFKAFDVEFTAREMREEWAMLVNHGRHRRLLR